MNSLLRIISTATTLVAWATFSFAETTAAGPARSIDPAEVVATLKRVAAWQLENPNGTDLGNWVIAPLYDGLIDASETTGDPRYLAEVVRHGIQSDWMPGMEGWTREMHAYFADNHAVGHAWLDIYLMNPSKRERLAPFQTRFDEILAHPIEEKLVYGQAPKTPGVGVIDRWTWCDALYMAPPTLARLAKATGDARYLDFLDAEYRHTHDTLFDPVEKLFYRDARFITRKSANGKKVFWSRGNGWVFAGLPILLEALPENRASRSFYTGLLQQMAPAVAAAQLPDGLWRPNMLDPEDVPVGETSGSAFFVYGLAWGVNHGLLNREKYWPLVERGWHALLTRITSEGLVGYVQRIGDAPASLDANSTQLYGTGGVLMAGSEILRALGAAKPVEAAGLLAQAERLVAEDRTPRARARFLPGSKGDLAWENNKVAYRLHGSAPYAGFAVGAIGAGDTGVGNGRDAYAVGDSPARAGIALWHAGKPVNAEIHDRSMIRFTKPDRVEIEARYVYPAIDGTIYHERRIIRLHRDGRLNEIVSRFSLDWGGRRPAARLEVAVGLGARTPDAEFVFRPESGVMAVWDSSRANGRPIGLGAVVAPGAKMLRQAPAGFEPKTEHAFALLHTDEKGLVNYRVGGGASDDEITSAPAWLRHLESSASSPLIPSR